MQIDPILTVVHNRPGTQPLCAASLPIKCFDEQEPTAWRRHSNSQQQTLRAVTVAAVRIRISQRECWSRMTAADDRRGQTGENY